MKSLIKENKWFIISMIIIIILFKIELPYYINMPGGTIKINDRIECNTCNKINGSINLLYVSEYVATIPTYLLSKIIPNWDAEKISEYQINNETTDDIFLRNKLMLEESIDSAILVAYKASKKNIDITNKKNVVIAITNNNNLKIGDEILEIDNIKVENVAEIREIIKAKKIHDKLKIKIIRNKIEQEIEVEVNEEKGTKIIGVVVTTDYDYKLNPNIKLKFKPSESGASGGLMLALSIYSKISDEDIIKGRKIAGTGTIDPYGNVGEIDGIKYKIMGAHKDKVDLILVPEKNYKEAIKVKKKNHYKMKIVKVKDFDSAIKYLKKKN